MTGIQQIIRRIVKRENGLRIETDKIVSELEEEAK